MAIRWDSVLAAAAARTLDGRLGGARLRAVFLDHGDRSLALHFREATLAFRLHPERGDLAVLPPADAPPPARSLAARLLRVDTSPDDRVLRFHLRRVRGTRDPFRVVVELMANQWNALVLEGDEGWIRHVLRTREAGGRVLAPGERYAPPPPPDRAGGDGPLSPERWRELLAGVPAEGLRRHLLRSVAWTSSINVDALVRAASGRGLEGAHALWASLLPGGNPRPCILRTPRGAQPYPVPLPDLDPEPVDDLLEAFAGAADRQGLPDPATALLPSGLREALEREAERARRRVGALERELENAPDPSAARAVGDLILARFGEVPSGAESAVLPGFDGESVEVELDPALPPHENAARYYERAARAERARERLPRLVEEARERARSLEALRDRVREGEAEVEEVRAALPPDLAGEDDDDEGSRLPYRVFRSSGGLEIRVGRSARGNDDLTFHHSSPDDVWMHARHAAGAHVILRWSGEGNPPSRDLAEAATLAALHSKARTSGSVPVDWTRRKYVRKPRKAPPGSVVPDRVSTIFVEPDPDLEDRLSPEG